MDSGGPEAGFDSRAGNQPNHRGVNVPNKMGGLCQ